MLRLVERARAGDARAFARLYRSLCPAIEAYVERRVADPGEAEDLVARTFEKLLTGLDRFDPERGSVRMWCFAIARNLVIDHHRGRALRLHATDPWILDRGGAGEHEAGDDPLDRLVRDERNAALLGLVRALPADRRELLALRYGEGLSTRDIAALLGLGEAAVRQRLSRTRRELERQAAALASGADARAGAGKGATDAVS